MATIFSLQAGAVAVLPTDDGYGLPLAIDGVSGSWYGAYKSILTGLQLGLPANVQFTHTLDNLIYIYTFGDRIGSLRVAGMAFQGGCASDPTAQTGLELILGAYAANKASTRQTPARVQIGTSPSGLFTGVLSNLNAEIARPDAMIAEFSFDFNVLPTR